MKMKILLAFSLIFVIVNIVMCETEETVPEENGNGVDDNDSDGNDLIDDILDLTDFDSDEEDEGEDDDDSRMFFGKKLRVIKPSARKLAKLPYEKLAVFDALKSNPPFPEQDADISKQISQITDNELREKRSPKYDEEEEVHRSLPIAPLWFKKPKTSRDLFPKNSKFLGGDLLED